MNPTKEWKYQTERNGPKESVRERRTFWGLCPQTPGILPLCCQSQLIRFLDLLGLNVVAGPSLVLAPESALRLLPSVKAAGAVEADKELCATMKRRSRPEVGRALHWCSNEPVSPVWPWVAWSRQW